VVLSHGDRGSYNDQSWLGESLAARGYIVAAVAHYNNTWNRNEPAATLRLWERPLDLSFLITRLLADPVWGPRIDAQRIGAAGHSSGGYSVLALAGALFEPARMQRYCASPERGPDCARVAGVRPDPADAVVAERSYRDPRVRAVLAMAPAVGPGIVPESLQQVIVPVLLVATADDSILLADQHVQRYARALPGAELLLLPQGGHFLFMPEITFVGRIMTALFDDDVSGRSISVERGELHGQIVQRAADFFGTALATEVTARDASVLQPDE
jgi:predicted dienelactone hydrolase